MNQQLATCALALCLLAGGGGAAQARLAVSNLRVEHLENPAVIDAARPRLSWTNLAPRPTARGERQTAYQISVASSREDLLKGRNEVWNTGRVASEQSYLIPYEGAALLSGATYWWRVRVWDAKGHASRWSEPARWGMGLLRESDWKAQWIEPEQRAQEAPLLRTTFELDGEVKEAKVYVCGLGYFELYLNGSRVGEDYLVPNFTNYTERPGVKTGALPIDDRFRDYRVLYLAYDVTAQLQRGSNALGAVLSGGYYKSPCHRVLSFGPLCLLCQLDVTMKDGTRRLIVSDPSWKTTASAITRSGIYEGETYDARLEHEGWSTAAYDDRGWTSARLCQQPPSGKLCAQAAPADRITETLRPQRLTRQADGSYLVEFDKEVAGWLRLTSLQGKRGDTVRVDYLSESPQGTQEYVLKGTGNEEYAPRFTWFGFAKAVVRGVEQLEEAQVTAEAVNTDVPVTSTFHTSNALFNRIHQIWEQAQIDNMHSGVASDCPHRERLPYTGDGQAACPTVMHNFDAAAFYQKWIRDLRDAQNKVTGYEPNGAPWEVTCGGGVGFGAAMCVMPWTFYQHYGDLRMLEESFDAMKDEVRYMLSCLTPDSTMIQNTGSYWMDLGDWNPPQENLGHEEAHTYFLWQCADLTARAAKALGHADEEKHYRAIADRTRRAYIRKFYKQDKHTFGDYGANIFALEMGVPETELEAVRKSLRKEIMETHGGHLNTGIFATKLFFETLATHGMNDVAYTAMNQTDFPGYGNWVRQGALTTWEQWDGGNSHNHPMYGGGLLWFYRSLAGVHTDEAAPGYRHILIRPVRCEELDTIYYDNETPYGKVASEKVHTAQGTRYRFTIPVGSTATIALPVGQGQRVECADRREVVEQREKDGSTTYHVGQGTYEFWIKD